MTTSASTRVDNDLLLPLIEQYCEQIGRLYGMTADWNATPNGVRFVVAQRLRGARVYSVADVSWEALSAVYRGEELAPQVIKFSSIYRGDASNDLFAAWPKYEEPYRVGNSVK
jgi:hypothetical protein